MLLNEILFISLISILILVFITFATSWLIARLLCKPKRYQPNKTPENFDLPFEDIEFYSGKVKLRGWFIPSCYSNPSSKIIILNHGWSSNMSRMLYLAKHLHKNGYSVLLFDFRGHGNSNSDGPITLLKFAEDIISAINFLIKYKLKKETKIGILSHSMGASAGILAASMDSRIDAVGSCSAFDNPQKISASFLRCLRVPKFLIRLNFIFITRWLGRPIESVAPINVIKKIKCPVFLIHGSDDKIVSPKNLERLYNTSNSDTTEKLLVPKGDHHRIIRNPEFAEYVSKFFNKSFESNSELTVINKIPIRDEIKQAPFEKKELTEVSDVI